MRVTLARPALGTLAVLAGSAALLALLRARQWPLGRYVVEGASMEPAYRDGQRVVVNRLVYVRRRPAAGEVVVLWDPERHGHTLLKRVAFDVRPDDDTTYVLGDNAAASRDSRAFGPVAIDRIIGKAWFRY
jgi:nickel-type superoxide dismutase maturation protease